MSLTRRCGSCAWVLQLWQLWWAVRISLWLCGRPVRLRLYSLPMERWQTVYSYPSASACAPHEAREPLAGVEPSG
jgi:hypothetical protein